MGQGGAVVGRGGAAGLLLRAAFSPHRIPGDRPEAAEGAQRGRGPGGQPLHPARRFRHVPAAGAFPAARLRMVAQRGGPDDGAPGAGRDRREVGGEPPVAQAGLPAPVAGQHGGRVADAGLVHPGRAADAAAGDRAAGLCLRRLHVAAIFLDEHAGLCGSRRQPRIDGFVHGLHRAVPVDELRHRAGLAADGSLPGRPRTRTIRACLPLLDPDPGRHDAGRQLDILAAAPGSSGEYAHNRRNHGSVRSARLGGDGCRPSASIPRPQIKVDPMHHASAILLTLFVIFVAAQLGAEIARRLKLPGVVGETAPGCIVGPSVLGWVQLDQIADGTPLSVIAEIGVVLLLFSVGLETRLDDLKKVGKSALLVGVLGVVIPFAAGALWAHGEGYEWAKSMFVAAAFVATSAGITARVLQELGVLQRMESRVILGAAVIDDILAMLLLGVVVSMQGGGELNIKSLLITLGSAVGFIAVIGWGGSKVIPPNSAWLDKPLSPWAALNIVLALGLGLAFLSPEVGLA